jgi:hypothetical protein
MEHRHLPGRAVKRQIGHPYSHFTAVDYEPVPNRSKWAAETQPHLRSSLQDRTNSLVDELEPVRGLA